MQLKNIVRDNGPIPQFLEILHWFDFALKLNILS